MNETYVKFYESMQGKCCPNTSTIKYCDDNLQLNCNFNALHKDTRNFLLDLDPHIPVIRLICQCLSLYHLTMIYVELGDDTANWKPIITTEMQKRISTVNWVTSWYNPKLAFVKKAHPIEFSKHLFSSQINAAFTFFSNKIANKYGKNFLNFLKQDGTFHLKIPHVLLSMDNLRFNGYEGPHTLVKAHKLFKDQSMYFTLCFPPIPGINIRYFTSASEIPQVIKANEELACLLLFLSSNDPIEVEAVLDEIAKLQTIQIPMAGSFGLRHMHKINWDGPASATYVAFLRQKDSASKFFAASTVVDCDYDIFESKILEFKNGLERHHEEFLLSFVCCGRRRKAAEAKTLGMHFDCPIIQMDVNGEVGHDCYATDNCEPAGKMMKRTFHYVHSFTTVLIYISWGNQRAKESK